jgi:hypothetical protein
MLQAMYGESWDLVAGWPSLKCQRRAGLGLIRGGCFMGVKRRFGRVKDTLSIKLPIYEVRGDFENCSK